MKLDTKIAVFNETDATYQKIEVWDTKNGKSVRLVKRYANGEFANNASAKQLTKP